MNKNIIIHAWSVHYDGKNYYLPYTHWVYLKEIVKYYNNVRLLSPVKVTKNIHEIGMLSLDKFPNVNIIDLPFTNGYAGSIKFFFRYYNAYKQLTDIDVFYARYPIPFGWLAKIFHNDKKRIIHFVGDPIHATKTNPSLSSLKKKIILSLFQPEYQMYLWACKDAHVYTNGYHIAENLKTKGIPAKGLISSTLEDSDFCMESTKKINPANPKLIYVGYLRKAKSIETIIKAIGHLQNQIPNASLTIVGVGEYEIGLKKIAKEEKIDNINFVGHIDDREKLNELLRKHDIFCFASLSEGSPRVVLEAMANGLAVVSTPVGSLPNVFTNQREIVFTDFQNPKDFYEKIHSLIFNVELYKEIRIKAYEKVRKFQISHFIKEIFDA
ncbi:glycosyltransferase family 4 protein [Oceanihabitans sediminis]|uniref:glycosyltransferase family 4 protein n=1 Tax=Oceanihabitans sediminis TaxID=1812012 RepID=UPI00299E3507|nr:glycosyltransferase family 4 protein [Oceanihabitans sediminis]MDX1774867.1 glycosyltransferase family 4 protein [Oceanihabitans sediminis]